MSNALNFAKDFPIVQEYIRARYWSKSHITENSCNFSRLKASKLWEEMNPGQQEMAMRALQILNNGPRRY
jgi:hypothetical protein